MARTKPSPAVAPAPVADPLVTAAPATTAASRFVVYSIEDPRTATVLYIGRTGRTMQRRMREHMIHALVDELPEAQSTAIRALVYPDGAPVVRPALRELRQCATAAEAEVAEKAFIKAFRAAGHPLTNALLPDEQPVAGPASWEDHAGRTWRAPTHELLGAFAADTPVAARRIATRRWPGLGAWGRLAFAGLVVGVLVLLVPRLLAPPPAVRLAPPAAYAAGSASLASAAPQPAPTDRVPSVAAAPAENLGAAHQASAAPGGVAVPPAPPNWPPAPPAAAPTWTPAPVATVTPWSDQAIFAKYYAPLTAVAAGSPTVPPDQGTTGAGLAQGGGTAAPYTGGPPRDPSYTGRTAPPYVPGHAPLAVQPPGPPAPVCPGGLLFTGLTRVPFPPGCAPPLPTVGP